MHLNQMQIIQRHIKAIMLISGIITCALALAVVAPQFALERIFGQTLEGPLAEVIVRSWGAMITLIGGMLIYGAFHPAHRNLVLVVASVSKLILVGLILTVGSPLIGNAIVTVVFDGSVSVIYVLYLVGSKISAQSHGAAMRKK